MFLKVLTFVKPYSTTSRHVNRENMLKVIEFSYMCENLNLVRVVMLLREIGQMLCCVRDLNITSHELQRLQTLYVILYIKIFYINKKEKVLTLMTN